MSERASIPAAARGSLGTVLISCVKDEGISLVEFIAHHRVLGFDAIFIASNDCSDGSEVLLATLAGHGVIGHADAPVPPGEGAQHLGYRRLRERFDLDRADWLMVLDVDEFLSVSIRGHRLGDLIGAVGDSVDIIALNAMTFGTDRAADADLDPRRVCERFTERVETGHPANGAIKSLTRRPARFDAIFNHNCRAWNLDSIMHVMRSDGSVFTFDASARNWPDLRAMAVKTMCFDVAHYNHYAIKSPGEFALRCRRGRGIDTSQLPETERLRHTETYFAQRAEAAIIPDDSILRRYGPAVEAEMARMRALPGVAAAEAACRRWYERAVSDLGGQLSGAARCQSMGG